MPLDDYEDRRPERRTLSEMVLPRTVRDHILRKEWDVSQQQIASAIRETLRVKHSRRQTVNNIGKDRVEEVLEKTGRKLMRGLLLKKSTTSAFEKLEQQYKAVEAEKKLLKLKELMKVQQQEDGVEGSMTDVQVMQDSAPREGGLNEDDDDDDGCDESGEEIKLSCSDESRYQCKGEQTAESEIHSSARSSTNKFPIVPEAAADSHSDDTTDHATQPMVHQANDNLSRTSVVCSRDDEKGHLDQLIAGGAAECAPHSSNSSSKAESALTLPTTGVNREDDTALVTQAVLVHQSDNRSTEGVVIGGIHDENSRSDQPITTTGAVRSINSRKRMMAKNFNTASVEV